MIPCTAGGIRLSFVFGCLILTAESPTQAEVVIHVKADSGGACDGSSWPDAFTDLQEALDEAAALSVSVPAEVWVAAGTYLPDRGTGDRTLSFHLHNNVALYGGFAGWEVRRDQRDFRVNETILSGDLAGNDDLDLPVTSDCCEATGAAGCSDAECMSRIDDLNASSNCDLSFGETCAETARKYCRFLCRPERSDNASSVVVALGVDGSAELDGFTVSSGESLALLAPGNDPSPASRGAGLFSSGAPSLRNLRFTRNASESAVAIYIDGTGELDLADSRLENNESFNKNGSIVDARGGATIVACDFFDNTTAGIRLTGASFLMDTKIRGHWDFALDVLDGPVILLDVLLEGTLGGSTACAIKHNGWYFPSRLERTIILKNVSNGICGNGGAIEVVNSLIYANGTLDPAQRGSTSAVRYGYGRVFIRNSTIAQNVGLNAGGLNARDLIVESSIIWGNSGGEGTIQDQQIVPPYSVIEEITSAETEAKPTLVRYIDNSIVEGWDGSLPGTNTSGTNPLFRDPLGFDGLPATGDEDFRLSGNSPAINTGDPNYLPEWGARDLDGYWRVLCRAIDIGAYEFGIGDGDCDGDVDWSDYRDWKYCLLGPDEGPFPRPGCEALDFDGDGAIDLCDYARFDRIGLDRD